MGNKIYSESEIKIIERIYKQYIRYLKGVISEDIFIDKLNEIGLDKLSDVKYSSKRSVLIACNRYINYYINEILKEDVDNVYLLRKEKDKLDKLSKNSETLIKIYCIYISYANKAITEEEYLRLVEGFDLSNLTKVNYTNITAKRNAFERYACSYAMNYLKLSRKEFESIGKSKRKIKLELNDIKTKEIIEKLYNHYLEYLNVLITEDELCDKALADGIFMLTDKNELDGLEIKRIIGEAVNYYYKEILGKTNNELLELKNNSLLMQNKTMAKSLKKYDDEAKKIMKSMYELIRDYYDLKIDYDTFIEIIVDTDINKVTHTKLKYKINRRIELFKYYAKFYATNFLKIEEEEYINKLNNSSIYKKSYQYYIGLCKGKINVSEFNTFETIFGINAINYAKEYAERNNLTDEFNLNTIYKQKDRYVRKVKNSRNYRFIMTLERNFVLANYCEMVEDYDIDLIMLRKECFDYLIVTYPKISSNTLDDKLGELRKKVDMVYDVLKKNKMRERQQKILEEKNISNKELINNYKYLIEEFVDGNYTLNEFINNKGISLKLFFDLLNIIELEDVDLFNKFKKITKADSTDNYFLTVCNINEVVKNIKFGITLKDNSKCRFELFDYYKLLSSKYSSFDKCLNLAVKILEKYDYYVLKSFVDNNSTFNNRNEEQVILSMRIIEDDREITYNEKVSIINMMKVNSIPITRKLFNQAVKRYLNNVKG